MTQRLQIGELARQVGLSVDAIRFYERSGLLAGTSRTAGGFRIFTCKHADDLIFIQKAQGLGFTLEEIRELMVLQDGSLTACGQVRELLDSRLAGVRDKLAALRTLEHRLEVALSKCDQEMKVDRPRKGKRCPVLEEFARGDVGRSS